jgi:transposase
MEMSDLIAENKALKGQIADLQFQLAQLQKLIYGAKRERFVPDQDPTQGRLFDTPFKQDTPLSGPDTKVASTARTTQRRKPPTRNAFPQKLKREKETLLPQQVDLEGLTQIGEDITELLAYEPASLYVRQIIRPRFVDKQAEERGVFQHPIPARLIPQGMVDESLIAQLIVEKIQFHTPLYRFGKKLKQAGVDFVSNNNLNNWFHKAAQGLLPLYHLLQEDMLGQPYNQADETPIPVLTKDKPGATHRGYMWALYNVAQQTVFFHYAPSRATAAAADLLQDYAGILQTDGYEVYERLQKNKGFTLIHCMAHARRKFVDAQGTAPEKADFFLNKVQQLYRIERKARDQQLNHEARYALRQKEALPILKELKDWLKAQLENGLLPKSPLGKAVAYAYKRWEGLMAYAHDGQLEIDNNLIENSIRPLALGRKNYLFAGSHDAAQSLACLYAIIGTAKRHGLNTHKYLTWLLRQVAQHKVDQQAIKWLPHKMSSEQKAIFLL